MQNTISNTKLLTIINLEKPEHLYQIAPYQKPLIKEFDFNKQTQGGLNGPLETNGGAFFS